MTQENKQSSMSPEERASRRAGVGKAASEKVAKSEQLNFRVEEQSIKELQQMAFERGVPVGSMIRDWVLERLVQEKLGKPELTGMALQMLDEFHRKLNGLFESTGSKSMEEQGKPFDRLRQLAGSEYSAHQPSVQEPSTCYFVAVPTAPGAVPFPVSAMPGPGPTCVPFPTLTSTGSPSMHEPTAHIDHLRAWEHLLNDQLESIRHQREEAERTGQP
jgi:hypothetical protein